MHKPTLGLMTINNIIARHVDTDGCENPNSNYIETK